MLVLGCHVAEVSGARQVLLSVHDAGCVFSRKITPWEVYEVEFGNYAAQLLQRGVLAEGCASTLQCLHADNGAIQKSSTLRSKMEWLSRAFVQSPPREQ